MMASDDLDEPYAQYSEQFEPRAPKRKAPRSPKRTPPRAEAVSELAETSGMEAGFVTTYVPARYEEIWLRDSLRPFYDEHLIVDVLSQVKGGKEASVYCCTADPSTGTARLAAKVYRPRMFRNLRNDAVYREGRAILTAEGRAAKKTDHRLMRAVGKKTAFGAQVSHTSWVMHEYTTMERLYAAGAAVPKPYAAAENGILMEYIGDEQRAAPALNEISLPRRVAYPLFQEILRTIELLLQHALAHGDLSAYNILFREGRAVLIDFPQVVALSANRQAKAILQRDITRVCEYFARQGVRANASTITNDMWARYGAAIDDDLAALFEPPAQIE